MTSETEDLNGRPRRLLDAASEYLPEVSHRKMFGAYALFAAGSIYAIAWPHDRIGLKIPDPARYQELLQVPGAQAWYTGQDRNPMSHWVLLPPSFYEDDRQLELWVQRAHAYALSAPRRPARRPRQRRPGNNLRVSQ